ncbi:hypothetical protein CWE21_13315 [Pseudidiomarina aquimaris]|uniref:RHS repeat-associated core domain-containing protein n=1 Tax=Pseudidiomarina aquimaris TaxID=641841 RepID=A0A432XAZ3_9GAMM|nr:RHS repeat-associated core domain-containing protein [Pseudidiomarina aquimaris]RUO45812.1 hypothetical protein CWE21_13315 [Pseudidiomarina aquimaris]
MLPSSAATLFDVAGGTPFTLRGLTDHEHIDQAQLIHMNGRVCDYNLGRFLSIDPLIQAPGNSQSLNPYSYIMNNPLAGTDPSGYASVGNLGFGEQQHCNFHCMIGYHGFTEAGSNGADGTVTVEVVSLGIEEDSAGIGSPGSKPISSGESVSLFPLVSYSSSGLATTELVGAISREQLGNLEGDSQNIYQEANEFFEDDIANYGEEREFQDKYAVALRSIDNPLEVYEPATFNSFQEANEYAGRAYHIRGYEKVWVNGYHYAGKSIIYKSATFTRGGYTGIENTIRVLAHESRHFNKANPLNIRKHVTESQMAAFFLSSKLAVRRYRNSIQRTKE